MVVVRVRQGTHGSAGRSYGAARNTARLKWRLRSGRTIERVPSRFHAGGGVQEEKEKKEKKEEKRFTENKI